MNRADIDVSFAVQGDAETVFLVRSAWDAATWESVRADILARIAAGQTPVIAVSYTHLTLPTTPYV